jgi:glycosyltransferase involved in cell wall biosynthesis
MKILWIPHTGWHISQRAHIFCRVLAQRHEIHVTDWVADFSTVRDYLSLHYLRNFTYRCYKDGDISVHGIPRISPAMHVRQLRRLNTAIFQNFVQRIIEKYQIEVVVGTFLLPPPAVPRLIFDLFDENVTGWQAQGHKRLAEEIDQVERVYLKRADVVVVASSVLRDKAISLGTSAPIVLIPNPVELSHFASSNGNALRSQFLPHRKIIGSVANYGKKLEVDLLIETAKLLANEPYVFYIAGAGSALAHGKHRVRSEGINNIIFAGPVPRHELPNVLDAFDVGLCIYEKTPMDDARSPMRLVAYSALGLPTVATDVEEIKRLQFPNVVLVQPTPSIIAGGIRRAAQMERQQPSNIADYDVEYLAKRLEAVIVGDVDVKSERS